MKIETFGNKEHPKILLLHPMLASPDFFEKCITILKEQYYLIIPTLSGHYENSTYISVKDEETQINSFLKKNKIDKIQLMIGFSLGGNIAYYYFCKNHDKIERLLIDSAPLFYFPEFIKKHFFRQYKKCLINVRKDKEHAAEELNKCFNHMGEAQKNTAALVTLDSLLNLTESCFHVDLYNLDEQTQKKITFLYGTEDIARLCLPRLKKYEHCQIIKLEKRNHCEYFQKELDNYIREYIIKNPEIPLSDSKSNL